VTDDERRNRNPAVEYFPTTRAEIEALPELHVADLELHRVYILQSARHIVTMNYMGKVQALHAETGDVVVCHQFHGPRVGITVNLVARNGCLYTGRMGDEKITLRKFTGPDA
jgi:hypothetical protein